MNTSPEIARSVEEERVEIATLPSRLLAAGVDYLVTIAIFVLVNRLNSNADYSFVFSFLSGLFYFGIVHSSYTRGQSLGKKVFGLRVVRIDGTMFLTPFQAATRYIFYLGIIILCAEAPSLVFRATRFSASPYVLEAHMLLVMAYFFCNVWMWLTSSAHRAVHDLLAHTVVLRGDRVPDAKELEELLEQGKGRAGGFGLLARPWITYLGSFVLAAFFWSLGFSTSEELQSIGVHRFEIEREFPVRILSLSRKDESISLEALLLDAQLWQSKEFAARFARYLLEHGGLRAEAVKSLQLTWYRDPSAKSEDTSTSKSTLRVELPSLVVENVESTERNP